MRGRIAFITATIVGSALAAVAVVVWLTVRSPADPLSVIAPTLDLPPGWAEMAVPEPGTPAHERLGHALGFSRSDWTVTAAGGRVAVEPGTPEFAGSRPPFELDVPEVSEEVRTPVAAAEVDGGWVVAYDRGAWGGAVWWFSPDGRERREVSRHQVKQFCRTPAGLFAAAGLAHLGANDGQLLRLVERDGRWRAEEVAVLPAAGYALATDANGDLVVAVSDGLVLVTPAGSWQRLAQDAGLVYYPNSVVLDSAGRVWVGMRGAVGVFERRAARLRLIAPAEPGAAADGPRL